ncbi:hypothetical protein BZG36_04585 [Bifiguratus adelaidae]|uniref:Exocyst complex component Sec8 n=1 Tax=Bifiguratus adelaidae TaxID=1938954 RepID=A0A261XUV1_9FUNG|nr:hypothetical protein BZG36_04585 [Bifiguratus adelaidae]
MSYGRRGEYGYEDVLREVRTGWEFMMAEDFDPVTLALRLMDDSSVGLGRDYGVFKQILRDLNQALQSITNDTYQGFNSSIGTFGGVLDNITDSQARVNDLKANLRKVKEVLRTRRADLLQLWYKSEEYKEMLSVLDEIDQLRAVEDKFEKLFSGKYYLSAAKVLAEALETLNKPEIMKIAALEDLRRNLAAQAVILQETCVEELHNHLYLKASYADSRWSRYTPDQHSLPTSANVPRSFAPTKEDTMRPEFPTAYPNGLNDSNTSANAILELGKHDALIEDTDRNPETDSYYYMEILLEALGVLNKLPETLDTIQQRLMPEINQLVDKTIEEVDERHANDPVDPWESTRGQINGNDIYVLDHLEKYGRNETLKDFAWTLYSKLEAVIRGHQLVWDVVANIKTRLSESNAGVRSMQISLYPFKEIWMPISSEIRAIIHDYLTDRERNNAAFTNPITSLNDMIHQDRQKERRTDMFTLMNAKPNSTVDTFYDNMKVDIADRYSKHVKGLKMYSKLDKQYAKSATALIVDKFAPAQVSSGHKLLAKPTSYNVAVLMEPTVALIRKMRETIHSNEFGPKGGTFDFPVFRQFLNDFLSNLFIPEIEDKIVQLVHQCTSDTFAFQEDSQYKQYSKWPIVKSATASLTLIQSLCRLSRHMPAHQEDFVRMTELVLLKYYERAFTRFNGLVAKEANEEYPEITIATSARWAQEESIVALLSQSPLLGKVSDDEETDDNTTYALNQSEITLETKLKQDRQLSKHELMFEAKKFTALAQLYHTLKWFVRMIWILRNNAQKDLDEDDISGSQLDLSSIMGDTTTLKWSKASPREIEMKGMNDLTLVLTEDWIRRIDKILVSFQSLAETCLFTIRIEGRCHTMYYLDIATREGNYLLEDETYEPDPYVLMLNADLVVFEQSLLGNLPENEQSFVVDGLPSLVAQVMISNAHYIKRMNLNGVQKMIRNILALQQNLTNLATSEQSSQLDQAREYYRLYTLGSENLLNEIRDRAPQFTFDEYRVILSLIHNVSSEDNPRNSTMQLTVKTLSNQQYTLDTNGSDTIQQLKKRLNEAMTESSEQVVLIHDKTELADNQTVQECGLEHGATVFAVNRPSSSSPTPSEPHSKAADVNATSSNKADQPTTSTEVVPKRKGRKHPRLKDRAMKGSKKQKTPPKAPERKSKPKENKVYHAQVQPAVGEEHEISDEELEFLDEHGEYADFLQRLDTKAIYKKEPEKRKKVTQAAPESIPDPSENYLSSSSDDMSESDVSQDEEMPTPSAKRKRPDEFVEEEYELKPRKIAQEWTKKDSFTRLPIKLASGQIVNRKDEFSDDDVEMVDANEDADEGDADEEKEEENLDAEEDEQEDDQEKGAKETALAAQERIAEVAQNVVEDPEKNIDKLKILRTYVKEGSVKLQRLAMLTQLAIFKDIIPGYRIRTLTEKELATQASKDVQKLRDYERQLLSSYQTYLADLEGRIRVSVTHFNFRLNIMTAVIMRMSTRAQTEMSRTACNAIVEIFQNDETGEASLDAVRLISKMLKSKSYQVHESALQTFLHLRLKDELVSEAVKGTEENQKARNKQQKKAPPMSKKQRKAEKERKEIEKEMREAESIVTKEEKQRTQSETLKLVFATYFRIIKHHNTSPLLSASLEGMSKFAHLINVNLFADVLEALKNIAKTADTSEETSSWMNPVEIKRGLLCVITAAEILSGQGEALNLDLKDFYTRFYGILLPSSFYAHYHATLLDDPSTGTNIPLTDDRDLPVDVFIQAAKKLLLGNRKIPVERTAAFAKRLSTSALNLPETVNKLLLPTILDMFKKHSRVDALLSSEEAAGNGVYLPMAEDPELCNPFATSLWEMALLQQHYHPSIAKLATDISHYTGVSRS